jgi:hypothetical protein
MVGGTGNIGGDPQKPYRDMLGLEVLGAKTGKALADGLKRVLQRRHLTVSKIQHP